MISGYPLVAWLGWLALAVGSALIPVGWGRRLAAAGLSCVGLALAAWRAGSTGSGGSLSSPDQLREGFLVVNGGLLLLGLGLMSWGASRGGRTRAQVASMPVTFLGVVLVVVHSGALVQAAGPARAVAAAGTLGLAGAIVVLAGRAAAASGPGRALARGLFSEPMRPALPARTGWPLAGGMLVGAAMAALTPHVAVVFLGVLVAVWSAHLLFHLPHSRAAPIAPMLTFLLLPAYWLLATIAGPEGLGMTALPLVPLSPAAEAILAAALLLVAWAASGLWPLHRNVPGGLTGVVGALLLLRIALPLTSGGLEYWRPLAVPVLTVGVWHAAARSRWPLAAVGGALLGIVSLAPGGVVGAGWLLVSALALEIATLTSLRGRTLRAAQSAAWVSATWGGLLVMEAGLRGEVVYTTLGAVGLGVLVAASVGQAITPSASSTGAPSE